MTVHVRVRPGDGTPLLLLNGVASSVETWDAFEAALGSRHTIAFDAPGVGRTPRPAAPLSIAALARLAVSVLDDLGEERVDVLGYSFGGTVAQQLALDFPDRVDHLVLAATTCGWGGEPATPGGLAQLVQTVGSQSMTSEAALWGQAWALWWWTSFFRLGELDRPTLVVHGTRDQLVVPANGRILARRIAGSLLAELPSDHLLFTHASAPLVASVVAPFLDEPDGEVAIKRMRGIVRKPLLTTSRGTPMATTTDLTDLTRTTQDKVLSAIEAAQETILDGYRSWASAFAKAVPADIPGLKSIPGVDGLPTPSDAVELTFDFAEKLLASQHQFISQLVNVVSQPEAPKKTAARS